ncbi:class I adenylate-forming enzyme family protein [Streptomyces brasiliensis]|uniref:Uncharacterized protein n=1 Tax=Streptomyces brasiliensis TaxID=1954 RepID=A0A917L9B8_9ACTN|nr:class I adenylate-forming enzyme family protein [Streptomyces brasiliensis]GGJ51298.1 hypothetical protein GCM10010121_072750 [Streptomyces brasiliensis]
MPLVRRLDSPVDTLLRRAAARAPGRPALTTEQGSWTFGELDREADRVARWVHGALRRADACVALACTLDAVFPALYFGVLRGGRPLALLDPQAGSAAARRLCEAAGAEIALVPRALAERLRAERARLPRLHTVVVTDAGPGGEPGGRGPGAGVLPAAVLAAAGPAPFETPVRDTAAVACIQHLPHPTGGLREVRVSHRNLLANAAQTALAHRLDGDSVVVNQLRVFRPALLGAAVHAQAQQVLVSDPDPYTGMTVSRGRRATHYYGLSSRLARLAAGEQPAGRLTDLRAVHCGGGGVLEPFAARRLERALRVPVLQDHGIGELGALSHVQERGARPERGAVGVPLPGTECRVVDFGTRAPAPVFGEGEVELRGPQIPAGRADGWLATGDAGYLDLDGRLHVVRRAGFPFASGDALVAPGVVEWVLLQDPRVADCTVADVPDPLHGSAVWAGVVLRGRARRVPGVLAAVTAHANARLGPGEQIRRLDELGTIPRDLAGRTERRLLIRQYLTAA